MVERICCGREKQKPQESVLLSSVLFKGSQACGSTPFELADLDQVGDDRRITTALQLKEMIAQQGQRPRAATDPVVKRRVVEHDALAA